MVSAWLLSPAPSPPARCVHATEVLPAPEPFTASWLVQAAAAARMPGWFVPFRMPGTTSAVPQHVFDVIPSVTSQPVTHGLVPGDALSILPTLGREAPLTAKLTSGQI